MSRCFDRHAEMYRAFLRACPAAKTLDPAEIMDGLSAAMGAHREKLMTPPPFVRAIVDAVAAETNVPAARLVGPERGKSLKPARLILVAKLKDAGLSTSEIGMVMGGRDHSTIIQAYLRPAAREAA